MRGEIIDKNQFHKYCRPAVDTPIEEIGINDPRYPKRLATLTGAPSVLYCRGNINLMNGTCIAVVGTRMMTDYGAEATRVITSDLARSGVIIVSGLALGVDAIAHRSALDVGGKTVAVLGSGVDDDMIGPRQNMPLARDILAHDGLICSEYPPGTPADKWTFPARNRIVSGLSRGVVVTEAAIKSGALITARLAAEQGRDVYAIPGSIFWPRSSGPHHLIQNGAMAVTSAQEILKDSDIESGDSVSLVSTRDPVQRNIVAILDDGPAHVEKIIETSDLSASEVMVALSHLELTGLVTSLQNGYWRKS